MRISLPLGIGLFILLIIFIASLSFPIKTDNNNQNRLQQPTSTASPVPTESKDYILEYSEGTCTEDSDCKWAGQGCGGGHGTCTNTPEKYEGAVTTCDVNMNFPSNKGYSCSCITDLQKCGWIK